MIQYRLLSTYDSALWRSLFVEQPLRKLPFGRPKPTLPLFCSFRYGAAPPQQYERTQFYRGPGFMTQLGPKLGAANHEPQQRPWEPEIVQNEGIRAFKVRVVQPDGKLGEPILLYKALDARKKDEKGKYVEHLRQVRQPDANIMFPVCRYYNIKVERERDLAQNKVERIEKAAKRQSKRLEINWTIGENDLGHRMDKMKGFLSKGKRVEVVLGSTRKRGWIHKQADSPQMARNLISKVQDAAAQVDGTKEIYQKGSHSQQVELCFEAPRKDEDIPAS